MNKFLIFVLFAILISNDTVQGITKAMHYSRRFNSMGLAVTPYINADVDATSVEMIAPGTFSIVKENNFGVYNFNELLQSYKKKYGSFDHKSVVALPKFKLILASELTKTQEADFVEQIDTGLVLVCDAKYESEYFSCDYENVLKGFGNSTPYYFKDSYGHILFADLVIKDKQIYVIPEVTLISGYRSRTFEEFMGAIQNSQYINLRATQEDKMWQLDISSDTVNKVSLFLTLAVFLYLISLTLKALQDFHSKYSQRNLAFFSGSVNKTTFEFLDIISNLSRQYLYAFLILIIPISLFIVYGGGAGLDANYLIIYIRDTIRPSIIGTSIENKEYFRLGVFLYLYVLIILIISSTIKFPLQLILSSIQNIKTAKKDYLNIKKHSLLALAMLIFSTFFVEAKKGALLFLIISTYFLYLASFGTQDYADNFNKHKRKNYTFLAIIFFIGLFLQSRLADRFNSFGEKLKLSENVRAVVTLPYTSNIKKTDTFNTFDFIPSGRVFINSYLVYTPEYTQILNTNIKKFEPAGNFIILNSEIQKITKGILSNEKLRQYLKTDTPTMLFGFNNLGTCTPVECSIKLQIDCAKSKNSLSADVLFVYFDPIYSEFRTKSSNFMKHPGCDLNTEAKIVEYNIPIKTTPMLETYGLATITGFEKGAIKSIELYKNATKIPLEYYVHSKDSKVLAINSDATAGATLNVYSFDTPKSLEINNKDFTANSVANTLNDLIHKKYIDKSFTMWSDQVTNMIIRDDASTLDL